jgi:hypothetical protein
MLARQKPEPGRHVGTTVRDYGMSAHGAHKADLVAIGETPVVEDRSGINQVLAGMFSISCALQIAQERR